MENIANLYDKNIHIIFHIYFEVFGLETTAKNF